MSKEEIMELLKAIYSATNLFEVVEVNAEEEIFTLKNWNKCNMFFKYEIDQAKGTITVCSLVGYFRRTYLIEQVLHERMVPC
jgi:N-acetyl-gamma-glutamylphosphate reductase